MIQKPLWPVNLATDQEAQTDSQGRLTYALVAPDATMKLMVVPLTADYQNLPLNSTCAEQ